ncbi:MAG: hypothetical protein HYV07_07640 [Deltaproteobacteria bacterium]|nr:hypothetical protein [Deltaproteobacteria bacterium]
MTHHLHILLNDTNPPIWRDLLVPGELTLADLHEVIQIAMGWTNSHLHTYGAGKFTIWGSYAHRGRPAPC